jgi:hypothetical protein
MNNKKWLRSHVERCLQDVWDVCRVRADDDGDYPFRAGTSACFVRIENERPKMVRIWAVAAQGVPRSAKVLGEINQVNSRSRSACVNWSGGLIVVEQAIHAKAVGRTTLQQALDAVGKIAEDVGPMIAAVYGGTTPFTPGDADVSEDAA